MSSARRRERSHDDNDVDLVVAAVMRLGKELTCSICMSLLRDPSVLPCTHAFCAECVTKLLAPENEDRRRRPMGGAPCPHCRKEFHRRAQRRDAKLAKLVAIYKRIH